MSSDVVGGAATSTSTRVGRNTKSSGARGRDLSKTRRPPKDIVVGKKVSAGLMSWKGADLTHSYYIGNVDIGVSVHEVKDGIEGQGVCVVELDEIPRRQNRFKSFRLVIKKSDATTIKDPDFWPEGVVLRRFFHKNRTDGAATTNTD